MACRLARARIELQLKAQLDVVSERTALVIIEGVVEYGEDSLRGNRVGRVGQHGAEHVREGRHLGLRVWGDVSRHGAPLTAEEFSKAYRFLDATVYRDMLRELHPEWREGMAGGGGAGRADSWHPWTNHGRNERENTATRPG